MSPQFGQRTKQALRHPLGLALAGTLVGTIAWSGHAVLMPCALALFALLPQAQSWFGRLVLCSAYFASSSWTVLPGAAIFYAHAWRPAHITLLWIGVALLLAAPWSALCRPAWIHWAIPLCLILESVPPLAAFSIANPLVSAGMLFPYLSWFGVLLFFALAAFTALRPIPALATALALVLATAFLKTPAPPPGWVGVNTKLGGQGLDTPDMLRDYRSALFIQKATLRSHESVIVFPENLVYRWSTATDAFWSRTLTQLQRQRRTLIVGATVQISGDTTGYRNAAVVRGATNTVYDQRIPMPVSMWKPLSHSGVPMNFFGRSIVSVAGQRAAILICYEQILTWPMLRSAAERPTVLVGIANDYWAANTYFPRIQAASLTSWARLFNLPLVTAVNE